MSKCQNIDTSASPWDSLESREHDTKLLSARDLTIGLSPAGVPYGIPTCGEEPHSSDQTLSQRNLGGADMNSLEVTGREAVFALLCLLACFIPSALAQTETGTIRGSVVD